MNLRRRRLVAFAHPANVDLTTPAETHALMFRDDPLVKYLRQAGDVPALRIADFLSRRQYHGTAMYREAYRGFGVEHQMGCTLPSPMPRFSVALAARLPEARQRWVRQQRSPATKNRNLPVPREPYVAERDGRQLTIRLLTESATGERTLAMRERATEWSPAPLQQLGLTAREAEVLLLVTQGKTNPEIGTILRASAGTVHKHTEHIFEKLGAETRTAAAARAWETFWGLEATEA